MRPLRAPALSLGVWSLVAGLLATMASGQTTGAWLDRLISSQPPGDGRAEGVWSRPGSSIAPPPAGSEGRDGLIRRCGTGSAKASAAVLDALGRAGWVPFLHLDRQLARDSVEVVGGMSAASPGCEPTVFNLFVFVGNVYAGTLSPLPMAPSRDGAVGAVRLTGPDTLTAEFARYTPQDPECCPSSRVRVAYRIERAGGRPVLVATDARPIR